MNEVLTGRVGHRRKGGLFRGDLMILQVEVTRRIATYEYCYIQTRQETRWRDAVSEDFTNTILRSRFYTGRIE